MSNDYVNKDLHRNRLFSSARQRREITPDTGLGNKQATEEWAKRMGDRRFDEEGMVIRYKGDKR